MPTGSPVTPTGSLSLPPHQLRDLLVASQNWQGWVGGDAGAAAAAVYLFSAPSKASLPHAIIDIDPALQRTRDGASITRFAHSGSLLLYIADVARHESSEDCTTDFLNRLDAVLADLELAPNQGGEGLTIDGYAIVNGPQRMPKAERDKGAGDIVEIILSIDITVRP